MEPSVPTIWYWLLRRVPNPDGPISYDIRTWAIDRFDIRNWTIAVGLSSGRPVKLS